MTQLGCWKQAIALPLPNLHNTIDSLEGTNLFSSESRAVLSEMISSS